MYSGESSGGKFPTIQGGYLPWRGRGYASTVDIAPNIFAIYPDYLTDPYVLVCPSDADASMAEERFTSPYEDDQDINCIGSYTVPSSDIGQRCASATDISYAYIGWVLDCVTPSCGTMEYGALAQIANDASDDLNISPDEEGPAQLIEAILDLLTRDQRLAAWMKGHDQLTPEEAQILADAVDGNLIVNPPNGNAGTDTVHRLSEGVERLLITDISNAGAESIAQSELPVMFDQIATVASAFNHVPGGSNVLYMDGHVEFLKYQEYGETLTNRMVATSLGMLAGLF